MSEIAVITGGAGFIGSHMADLLLKEGYRVKVIDNLKRGGHKEFIKHNLDNENFKFVQMDIKEEEGLKEEFKGASLIVHFAANADVKGGVNHPTVDFWENSYGTSNVLEAMRANNVKDIIFSSTGSIYGDPEIFPTPEEAPFPIQTSMYAASKLAGEGLIQAYCEAYDMRAFIFRFVSIFGERYTHGLIFDFFKQLNEHPKKLNFLSDGTPLKSYLYVGDCIGAMWTAYNKADKNVNIFNLGTDEAMKVKDIADIVVERLGLNKETVEYNFSPNPRGWIGDSPHIHLDTARIQSLGWKPALTISQAAGKTVQYLKENKDFALKEDYFREKITDFKPNKKE